MTKRKPRARASTVERWLREGIPERTFDRLVRELAPSESTARRWAREELIPERRLRELKPPRARARPAPAPPSRARAPVPGPKRTKPTKARERATAPRFPGWRLEEREAAPPRRAAAPAVLTREQLAGMRSLGLSPESIAAAGREETQDERDERLEREAIAAEAPAPPVRPVTPLELAQARELARLRVELERAQRAIEGPPKAPPSAAAVPVFIPFRFDTEPKTGEGDDAWLERIAEEIVDESRIERPSETREQRADRLVNQVRRVLTQEDSEVLMDLIADEMAMQTGENIRDIYRTYFSPGWRGAA